MVEIKSGQTVTSDYIKAAQRTIRFAPDEALEPWLIHGGGESYERNGVQVIGWKALRSLG
jgi:hypothetical protein